MIKTTSRQEALDREIEQNTGVIVQKECAYVVIHMSKTLCGVVPEVEKMIMSEEMFSHVEIVGSGNQIVIVANFNYPMSLATFEINSDRFISQLKLLIN